MKYDNISEIIFVIYIYNINKHSPPGPFGALFI